MKPITAFLDECCLVAPNARFPGVDVYLAYVHWCLQAGVPVQDQFTFVDLLECCGMKYRERKKGCYFKGLAILPQYRVAMAQDKE